jgi:TM2 domain
MAPICPYDKKPIEGPEIGECPVCGTPHHIECWFDNRGCTTYGCPEAPEDEPKLALPPGASGRGTQPGTVTSREPALPYRPAKRVRYMLLGLFFGAFGIHNLYAGRLVRALIQLSLSCLTLLYALPVCALWALGDVCFVSKDGKGRRMV